jgi:hypothetical protein
VENGQAPRLPGPKDRLAVIGTTGSGKTVAALWHLSRADMSARPWIAFDFKDDENIAQIEHAEHVGLDFRPGPKSKGLYVVHPMRGDDEAVNSLMLAILKRGNVGVYLDEPDINKTEGFEDVLRKGRSHYVPVIALTQRPVDCNRYMLSEAGFYQLFDLADEKDWARVRNFVPLKKLGYENEPTLKKYHSLYFDRDKKRITPFMPVPEVDTILENIDEKLAPSRTHFFI